ncbi:MAG: iron ABC transporter permease [Alistipes sp.]|nr:iron ABC transporter permease [Alistipes sp.]
MRSRTTILFIVLSLVLCGLFIFDVTIGEDGVDITFDDVVASFSDGDVEDYKATIVIDIRLVKAIMALLAGIALALSGLQMQTLIRNPMAGPYTLGISSGASLGVALFILGAPLGQMLSSELSTLGIAGAAWIGALATLFLVGAISQRIKDIMVVLIIGIMISSAVGAVVQILQFMSQEEALKNFVVWTMGSLGGVTWDKLYIIAPMIIVGLVMAVAVIKPMNMLLLGEGYARTMGLNVARTRLLILLSTTLLAGTVTAFCGPIGFIGMAMPHLARAIFANADHRTLLPASALMGAISLLVCDILSKMYTLPINALTALLGIPIIIWVIVKKRNIV